MPDFSQLTQTQMVHLLNEMERRLRALETAPRAGYTTLTSNSGLSILDVNGVKRMVIGSTADGGDVGIWLLNVAGEVVGFFGTSTDQGELLVNAGADNLPVLAITSDFGFSKPQYTLVAWPDPQKAVDAAGRPTTVSGTDDTMFNIDFVAVAPNVTGQIFAVVPGGSTATVKVLLTRAGGGTASAHTFAGLTSSQFLSFDDPIPASTLLPGETDVVGHAFRLSLTMARTAGAGTLALGLFEPLSNHV